MEHIRKTKKKLGVGARGVVYEGYDEERGRFVAVKEIPFFDGVDGGWGEREDDVEECEKDDVLSEERRAIVREITLMERFEHPHLVTYYGARRSAVGVQIIMELVNGGSLDALIRRHGSLRESVVRSYAHDILEGLAYLHDTARVCHRDVKPGNVLITADGRCKLTDFGESKLLDENVSMRTTVGTPWYMAPEVINGGASSDVEEEEEEADDMHHHHHHFGGERSGSRRGFQKKNSYTTSADIWSFGATVFEMISGRKPFAADSKNITAVLFAIASADGTPPRLPDNCEASDSLRAFLGLCFVRDPRLRPRARELLLHQWFMEPNSPKSRNARVGNTHKCRPGYTEAENSSAPSPTSHPSLRMFDTADLLDSEVQSPVKRRPSFVHRVEERRKLSTHNNVPSGFFSSDGHYIDLLLASPLIEPPTRRKDR